MRDRAVPRARSRVALALTLVLASAILIPATSYGASGTVSVVDYSQCANGTATGVDCNQNWINGILQKSNSHFKEGDVTPQRVIVTVTKQRPGNADHTITLRYQARKGTTHAYDSLATWNTTVTGADRCANLTAAVQTSIGCGTSLTPDTFTITEDPTVVQPFTSLSGQTKEHDQNGGVLKMYNGDITAMSQPQHDAATCSGKCADDYATTVISFSVASVPTTVELLFGGHLAVSPTNRGGWGAGLGASNINGGPYHIKWDGADGGSVGNRDNQIMGDAIQALAEPGISTSASPSTAKVGTAVAPMTDTVTLAGASDPTGAVTLSLWGPYAAGAGTCGTDPNVIESAVAVGSITFGAWAKTGGGTGLGTWTRTGTVASYTFGANSAGTYYWVATVAADGNNTAAGPEGCNEASESITVTKENSSGDTAIVIKDSAHVAGNGTIVPTGNVNFTLYDNDSTCSDPLAVVSAATEAVALDSNGDAATTVDVVTETGHAYYWNVDYVGDDVYNGATLSDCHEAALIT